MKNLLIISVVLSLIFLPGCFNVTEEKPARIAFAGIEKDRKGWYVFSMEPDGSDRILLARHLNSGQHEQWWSDDGRLVYVEGAYREPAIWLSVIDVDGTNHRQVLDISGMVIRLMAISPDGETILLVCRAATPRENPEGQSPENVGTTAEFYSLDADSGAIRRLRSEEHTS